MTVVEPGRVNSSARGGGGGQRALSALGVQLVATRAAWDVRDGGVGRTKECLGECFTIRELLGAVDEPMGYLEKHLLAIC